MEISENGNSDTSRRETWCWNGVYEQSGYLGNSDNPLNLSREYIKKNQKNYFNERVLLDGNNPSMLYLLYVDVLASYILRADNQLGSMLRRIYSLKVTRLGSTTHAMNYMYTLLDGLAGIRLLTKDPKNRLAKRLVKDNMKILKKRSKTRAIRVEEVEAGEPVVKALAAG